MAQITVGIMPITVVRIEKAEAIEIKLGFRLFKL